LLQGRFVAWLPVLIFPKVPEKGFCEVFWQLWGQREF
jgi:hypothetical protein